MFNKLVNRSRAPVGSAFFSAFSAPLRWNNPSNGPISTSYWHHHLHFPTAYATLIAREQDELDRPIFIAVGTVPPWCVLFGRSFRTSHYHRHYHRGRCTGPRLTATERNPKAIGGGSKPASGLFVLVLIVLVLMVDRSTGIGAYVNFNERRAHHAGMFGS